MRLAWLTDVHLNFVPIEGRRQFYASIRETHPDAVLLSGDIAEGVDLLDFLHEIERGLAMPIYFVLGNHDFYRSSFADVRKRVRSLGMPNLLWLTDSGVQLLGEETALIGHDGWADGRFGDYFHSRVFLNDYVLIKEFAGLTASSRLEFMNRLADEAAAKISKKLSEACGLRRRIILVTHVPPFREACWYEGKPSDDEWLPHFASKAMGDAIVEVMDRHPQCDLLVLCGHTHGQGMVQIRPNVLVKTGGAEYRRPIVQEILDVK
jgi:Icc protein